MRRKTGTIFMILGTALVLAALSLFLWNQWENQQAGASADKVLPQVIEAADSQLPNTESQFQDAERDDADMTEVLIDGYAYIGYLSIPAIGLELPVLSEWDYARLKIAPCRYAGSVKTDNLVIAAHNYTRFFWPIKNLTEGNEVIFTDMDGVVSFYKVVTVELLSPADVEEMTAGEYDLTLFTCTYGGQSRVTVRCDYAEE